MSYPKIVYTPSSGIEQTLSFTAPPRQQPGYSKAAVRHDNVSTSGVRESVLERIDTFLEFTVDYIRPGTDLASWSTFLDYALTGGPFDFYPDAAQPSSTSYLLENTNAQIQYKAPGAYSLALKLRELVQ